jgi:anti-sigma factor RsiW
VVEEMACNELVEIVTDYLDGTLPAQELAGVREHLSSCDGCQAHIEQMRATVRVLRSAPEELTSPQAANALVEMFRDWAGMR